MIAILAAATLRGIIPDTDVASIIAESVEANELDWRAAPEYNYLEQDRLAGVTRTYQVLMILGSPYRKLVALNGRPLPPKDRSDEESRLQRAMAERKNETEAQRAGRLADYRMDRRRDHSLLDQLVRAFDFTFLEQKTLGGRTVYVLRATPRTGYTPPNRDARVLTGMAGQLWIDAKTHQWVKVEAQVIHPVSIEGFVARVGSGNQIRIGIRASDDRYLAAHSLCNEVKSKNHVRIHPSRSG